MKKIQLGLAKEINFQLKNFNKNFTIKRINRDKLIFDVIVITPNTELDYKLINASKKIKVIFIMSLHLISKIKLKKIRKDIKILWFGKKSKSVLDKITPTPEFIFALLIILSKNFLKSQFLTKKNIWDPKKTASYSHEKMISTSTLGIIGYGRIGKRLMQIAKTFGMKILVYSNKPKERNASLKSIANKSDFVSVNLSLKNNTKNFIDKKFFAEMKKNSYFINTSKGAIVNYAHLLNFLGKNIKGAAIDVYKIEKSNDPEVIRLCNQAKKNQNLIITPHVAGGTLDSVVTLQKHCLDIIQNYFKTR